MELSRMVIQMIIAEDLGIPVVYDYRFCEVVCMLILYEEEFFQVCEDKSMDIKEGKRIYRKFLREHQDPGTYYVSAFLENEVIRPLHSSQRWNNFSGYLTLNWRLVMTVIENERVLDHPDDLKARAALSWAATLAMSGLQDCGRSNAGFPAHWIQHAVGALTDSSHGEGLAVINPAWLEFVNQKHPQKFVQFAERVFRIERTAGMSDVEYGQAGIDALKDVFRRWGLPVTLGELGVTESMIPDIIQGVLDSPETYVFEEEMLEQVLNRCMR